MTVPVSHTILFNLLPETVKTDLQLLDWKNGVSLICLKKGVFKQKNQSSLKYETFCYDVMKNICASLQSLTDLNPIFKDFPICVRRISYTKAPGLYVYLDTNNIEKHSKESLALLKAQQLNQKLDDAVKSNTLEVKNDNS